MKKILNFTKFFQFNEKTLLFDKNNIYFFRGENDARTYRIFRFFKETKR